MTPQYIISFMFVLACIRAQDQFKQKPIDLYRSRAIRQTWVAILMLMLHGYLAVATYGGTIIKERGNEHSIEVPV